MKESHFYDKLEGIRVITHDNSQTLESIWNMIAMPCIQAFETREAIKLHFNSFLEQSVVNIPRELIKRKEESLKNPHVINHKQSVNQKLEFDAVQPKVFKQISEFLRN